MPKVTDQERAEREEQRRAEREEQRRAEREEQRRAERRAAGEDARAGRSGRSSWLSPPEDESGDDWTTLFDVEDERKEESEPGKLRDFYWNPTGDHSYSPVRDREDAGKRADAEKRTGTKTRGDGADRERDGAGYEDEIEIGADRERDGAGYEDEIEIGADGAGEWQDDPADEENGWDEPGYGEPGYDEPGMTAEEPETDGEDADRTSGAVKSSAAAAGMAAAGGVAAGMAAGSRKKRKKEKALNGKKRRGRRVPAGVLRAVSVLLGLALACVAILLIRKYTPTTARMSEEEYFGTLPADELAVILQDEIAEDHALLRDGALYLDYDQVLANITTRFYWDEPNEQLLYTTADDTYRIPLNEAAYTTADGEQTYERTILLSDGSGDGGMYLSADFLQQYVNVDCSMEDGASHVLVRWQWGETLTARAAKETSVRYRGGIKSRILTDLNKGERVYVLEELENWTCVLTDDGYIGYVQKKKLTTPAPEDIERDFDEMVIPSRTKDSKITTVWHAVYDGDDGSDSLESLTENMTGVDVIIPTWFSLSDNSGGLSSSGTRTYVKKAKALGLEVWGLISDFSSDMDTSKVLASTVARKNVISQLMNYAEDLGLSGINLDFEYQEETDGYSYVQFVRELSVACRKAGLILSVDVPVPYDFNSWYDRAELGAYADYVVIMGYDETYAGSDHTGSVASLSFERNGIEQTIAQGVPANKILSGIPFYTRIWYSSYDDAGTLYIDSTTLSMAAVNTTLNTYSVTPVWDEECGQYYADWTLDNGVRCEIWVENAASLAEKAALCADYELGGLAAWALGYETDDIWAALSENRGE